MNLYFTVPPSCDGVLLRTFLRQCLISTELSRAVKFRGGGYFVDGEPFMANRAVHAGQVLSFALPPELTSGAAPEGEITVKILYEDAFAMVVDKPAGIAVHPTLNYGAGTLANGYAALMHARGESPVFRAVNRIDKDTSGLVLLAKNAYAAPLLASCVQKKYFALPEGVLPLGEAVIDAPLGRRGDSIIGRCVTPEGKPSRTEYEITRQGTAVSLAVCTPVTGRTHQIRVHFSSIGHPLAGDDLYGGSRALLARQALHCGQMMFEVPCGEIREDGFAFSLMDVQGLQFATKTVQSALPPEFEALLAQW